MKLNINWISSAVLALGISLFPASSHAAKFANQFTEFELPPQWQCSLEGAEWVCQSTNESKKKDAIIVLAAKLKGDQDSLDQYLTYLKAVKSYNSVQGKPIKSDPKYAKTVNLNGQAWVDSIHQDSEIPGFTTRYLATVKDGIGVLITYSINKSKYQEYLGDFDNLVRTLKVFVKTGGLNAAPSSTNLFQNTTIPTTMSEQTVFGNAPQGGADSPAPKKKDDDSLLFILIGAAIIGFIILKKKRG
jgi:hypothetical protein